MFDHRDRAAVEVVLDGQREPVSAPRRDVGQPDALVVQHRDAGRSAGPGRRSRCCWWRVGEACDGAWFPDSDSTPWSRSTSPLFSDRLAEASDSALLITAWSPARPVVALGVEDARLPKTEELPLLSSGAGVGVEAGEERTRRHGRADERTAMARTIGAGGQAGAGRRSDRIERAVAGCRGTERVAVNAGASGRCARRRHPQPRRG